MALADIISAVNTDLNTGRPVQVTVAVGERFLQEYASPPRVVWIPSSDSFVAPMKMGRSPRALWDRKPGVAVHVWAAGAVQANAALQSVADLAATEGLVNDLVASIHRVVKAAHGFYELSGAEWITAGQVEARGLACVLSLSFLVPVVEATSTTATILTVAGSTADSPTGAPQNTFTFGAVPHS
jgi:hypothetical protein